jgi:hypothetical protein
MIFILSLVAVGCEHITLAGNCERSDASAVVESLPELDLIESHIDALTEVEHQALWESVMGMTLFEARDRLSRGQSKFIGDAIENCSVDQEVCRAVLSYIGSNTEFARESTLIWVSYVNANWGVDHGDLY